MKLELPDNNASVLFHMGNALQSIARDIDTSLPVNGYKTTHTETVGDVSHSVTVEPSGKITMSDVSCMVKASLDEALDRGLIEPLITPPEADFTGEQVIDHMSQPTDTIDADGLPWDQRIHSRGKTRLADNTWRMARKPSDKSDEEWAEYVETVKVELRELMAIPVTVTYDPNEADPFAIDNGPFYWEHPESCSFGILQTREQLNDYLMSDGCCVEITKEMYDKLLSESKDVVIPPPLVTPPVVDAVVTPPVVDVVVTPPVVDAVVTPPVVDAPVVTGPTTFPELMKFITVNNKKLTKESVDEALKAQGLASIALLAARTDLIPQVHAALVKLL